jgi:hypothetical protein
MFQLFTIAKLRYYRANSCTLSDLSNQNVIQNSDVSDFWRLRVGMTSESDSDDDPNRNVSTLVRSFVRGLFFKTVGDIFIFPGKDFIQRVGVEQQKRKNVGLFQGFFHPSCQLSRSFQLFAPS